MEKFESQELLELVPTNVIEDYKLTKKQSVLLGLFIVYNNLDQTKNNGFFYRSNKDICQDIDISEPTLITAITKLEQMELIERKTGNRTDGASEYKLNKDLIFNTKINTKNLSDNFSNNLSNLNFTEILGIIRDYQRTMNMVIELLLKSNTKNLSNNLSNNFSTDTESETDTEIETDSIYNNIINNNLNIKENSNNININKNTNSNKEKDNNINNITEKETEVEENLKEEKTEVEETKTVQDDNIEFASAPTEDINETVEDDEDDTKSLSDEELEARLIKFYHDNGHGITNETEYNDFVTVFKMILQNFLDYGHITKEQFEHSYNFIILTYSNRAYSEMLKNTKTEEKALSEPSKEETLTTIQEDKENVSEPTEMASDEEIYDAFGNDIKKEMEFAFKETENLDYRNNNLQALETEYDAVFVNPMEVKIEVDTKKEEMEALKKKCLARMKSLYSSASTKDEVNSAYKTIVNGLETLHQEGKLDNINFSNLKGKAWFMYTDTVNALSKKAA